MTNCDSAALRRYYRSIRDWLPCKGQQKRRILAEIRSSVASYLENHPEADFSQLEAHFGTPQQIASGYVEDLNTEETLRALRIRRKVFTVIAAGVLAALLIWGGAVAWAIIDENISDNGYLIEELVP